MEHLVTKYTSLTEEADKIAAAVKSEKRGFKSEELSRIETITNECASIKRDMDVFTSISSKSKEGREMERDMHKAPAHADYSKKEVSEFEQFDLVRTLQDLVEGKPIDGPAKGILERGAFEAHRDNPAKNGGAGSYYIPAAALMRGRGMNRRTNDITATGQTSVAGDQGGQLVVTDIAPPIGVLWNPLVLQDLGVTFLPNCVGNVRLPRGNSGSSPAMKLEVASDGTAVSADGTTYTFSNVQLTPKRLPASVYITKQEMKQVSYVQTYVVDELTQQLMSLMELYCLQGQASNGPTGAFLKNSSLPLVTLEDSTNFLPDYNDITNIVEKVESANALRGNLNWLSNPKVKKLLKRTPVLQPVTSGAAFPEFIYDKEDKTVDEYPFHTTTNIPSTLTDGASSPTLNRSPLLFGNWKDFVVANWGGLEISVNPWINDAEGLLRVTFALYFDCGVRRNESFAGNLLVKAS